VQVCHWPTSRSSRLVMREPAARWCASVLEETRFVQRCASVRGRVIRRIRQNEQICVANPLRTAYLSGLRSGTHQRTRSSAEAVVESVCSTQPSSRELVWFNIALLRNCCRINTYRCAHSTWHISFAGFRRGLMPQMQSARRRSSSL
jgi:hypothetical protein